MRGAGMPLIMACMHRSPGRKETRSRTWLARLSLLLAALAIVIVVVVAGLKGIAVLAAGLVGAVVSVTAAYFFLSRRGMLRWLSFGLFVLAPIAMVAVFAVTGPLPLHALLPI